jgi:hypothetical protein
LEADLDKHIETLRQRAAYAPSPRTAAPLPSPATGEGAEAPPDDQPQAPEPPSRTEFLLCEFLVEHEHDGEVLELVERHLPLDLLPHPFARALVEALLTQWRSGGDRLVELCQSVDPVWQPLIGRLLANKNKMLSAREITKDEAVRDLIRALWIMRLKEVRNRLCADNSPESERPRFHLSLLIKQLETAPSWEAVAGFLCDATADALTPGAERLDDLPPSATAAAPCAHATDSAYATADPAEFPPSEYPPDEMPD